MAGRGFQVTASTMGQGNPAHLSEGRWYRYGGSKPLEDTPPEVTAGGAARTERRERRIDAFADALTCLGVTDPANAPRTAVIEAAKRIRVSEKTAMGYRTALRQRQQERSAP